MKQLYNWIKDHQAFFHGANAAVAFMAGIALLTYGHIGGIFLIATSVATFPTAFDSQESN